MDKETDFNRNRVGRDEKYVAAYGKMRQLIESVGVSLREELNGGRLTLTAEQQAEIEACYEALRVSMNQVLPALTRSGLARDAEERRTNRSFDSKKVGNDLLVRKLEETSKKAFVISDEQIKVGDKRLNKNAIRGTQADVIDFILKNPNGIYSAPLIAQVLVDDYSHEYATSTVATACSCTLLKKIVGYGLLREIDEKGRHGVRQYELAGVAVDARSEVVKGKEEQLEVEPEPDADGTLNIIHEEE
jgi:hypothetical protein